MGVLGFYRWLVQRYPLIRRRLSDASRPRVDNLYIDFNCLLYNSLRLVSVAAGTRELIVEVCRFLDLLVQLARPQCLVFVAVDGPAPFAKASQQRTRRFLAARDSGRGGFTSLAFSIGTAFMAELSQALRAFIEERSACDAVWARPQVLYSSHCVPGEAEH
jgi:5'-3' exonuclease